MRKIALLVVLAIAILLVAFGCERKVTEQVLQSVSTSSAEYIGTDGCAACHAALHESFMKTGHPFKLNEAEDAQEDSYYPFTTIPSPPSGIAWDDVDKVIGGFWWKARFIRESGAIVTGPDVQYNFLDQSWTGYHDGEKVPYDCGPCHMTAYVDTGNQEGKDSLIGTWAFNGIQCEECHGPGEFHAGSPYDFDMIIDYSNEGCGKCHIRGDVNAIPASGGFIKHHEQWNEMFTTKHSTLQCVNCHDVHIGLHPNNPERAAAIKITCEDCHFEEAATFEASAIGHAGSSAGPDCVDCHMAKAAKSAVAAGTYEGDVHSHLWRINTDANAEMFNEAGTFANGYLTLEYTCLQCHASEDKEWAATYAGSVHASSAGAAVGYVGSEACSACHQSTYDDFILTGHPFKLNEAEDAQEAGYYPFTTLPSPPPGLSWDDVDKVIGGFRWKARFIRESGAIITGSQVQYNFATGGWVGYHDGELLPYDCGPCHMTGYRDTGHQEGKDSLIGTWAFNGVHCEECHGPGEAHVASAYDVDMIIDRSAEACGKCHIRGDVNKIPASGGFIKHHEQWNEMFTTKHTSLTCVDCHDPHMGLHPNHPDREAAIKLKCENCHVNETQSFLASSIDDHIEDPTGPECIDCHMPKAAKSAVALGTYEGDVRSHLWRINIDPEAEMFNEAGTEANGYLTVEYTCLQCHSTETKEWAAGHADEVHNGGKKTSGLEPWEISRR